MIEFYGRITLSAATQSQLFLKRKQGKAYIIFSPICLLIAVLFFILWLALGAQYGIFISFISIMVLFAVIYPFIGLNILRSSKHSAIDMNMYSVAYIQLETYWLHYSEEESYISFTVHYSDIIKIVDLGNCYIVYVKGGSIPHIICDKSCLCSGTIEEFESEFADYFV